MKLRYVIYAGVAVLIFVFFYGLVSRVISEGMAVSTSTFTSDYSENATLGLAGSASGTVWTRTVLPFMKPLDFKRGFIYYLQLGGKYSISKNVASSCFYTYAEDGGSNQTIMADCSKTAAGTYSLFGGANRIYYNNIENITQNVTIWLGITGTNTPGPASTLAMNVTNQTYEWQYVSEIPTQAIFNIIPEVSNRTCNGTVLLSRSRSEFWIDNEKKMSESVTYRQCEHGCTEGECNPEPVWNGIFLLGFFGTVILIIALAAWSMRRR